jgi:hypothetical protein
MIADSIPAVADTRFLLDKEEFPDIANIKFRQDSLRSGHLLDYYFSFFGVSRRSIPNFAARNQQNRRILCHNKRSKNRLFPHPASD